jgi:hypothetical protein
MFSKKFAACLATSILVALLGSQAQAQGPGPFPGPFPFPPAPLTPAQILTLNAEGKFAARTGFGVGQVGFGVGQVLQGRASIIDAQANVMAANSGLLDGAANAIDAQGTFLKRAQEARLLHEQVKQSRVETRRREIEMRMWERDRLPTLADDQERARREQVRLAQKAPPVAEVLSGKSLNDLLRDCQILQGQGVAVPPIPLNPIAVQRVNVVTAGSSGNAALLRAPRLAWPPLLAQDRFKAARERVEALVAQAKRRAGVSMTADTERDLSDAVSRLEEQVRALVAGTENVSTNQAIEATRFLKELRATARVLQQPNVGGYLTGSYTARGNTAAALVRHMTEHDLVFAPAAGNNDTSYVAVHRALAAYSAALQAAAGTTLPDRSGLLSAAQ